MEDVWRWRAELTSRISGESIERQLREIVRLGDEAAMRFGLDGGVTQKTNRVAEVSVGYGGD